MINIFIKDRTNQLVDICKSLLLNTFVTDGEMGQFKELIYGPTVNIHGTDSINGWTPLHYIFYFSKYLFSNEHDLFDVFRFLIQKHAYVNAKTNNGETPLHVFASYKIDCNLKDLDIVNFLIENGTDVNEKRSDGATPLHLSFKELLVE